MGDKLSRGAKAKVTLWERSKVPAFQPMVTTEIKGWIQQELFEGETPLSVATKVRREYRSGRFDASINAFIKNKKQGPKATFAHLKYWRLADWHELVKKVWTDAAYTARSQPSAVPDVTAPIAPMKRGPGRPPQMVTKRKEQAPAARPLSTAEMRERHLAELREKAAREAEATKALAEAEARAALDKSSIEGMGEDAARDLKILRELIRAKLSLVEQANLLVELARSDDPRVAAQALEKIRFIQGLDHANKPEAPTMAPLFSVEMAPSIR